MEIFSLVLSDRTCSNMEAFEFFFIHEMRYLASQMIFEPFPCVFLNWSIHDLVHEINGLDQPILPQNGP